MRISDWSSDVCSSDLLGALAVERQRQAEVVAHREIGRIALQRRAVERLRRLVLAGLVAQDAERIVGPRVLRIAVRRAVELHGGQGGLAERHVELAEADRRAHVCTPATKAYPVCSLLLHKNT